MNILGIETSCDETAAAVIRNGQEILSNVITSQVDLHKVYGGVVPEIAARSHIETIIPVIEEALELAFSQEKKPADRSVYWAQVDAIAVTYGPGLLGSLLIGTLTAKTLALVKKKPLYAIDHVMGHAYANMLLEEPPRMPMLSLIVSGGHTQLVLFEDHFKYQVIGKTLDDAVGEAFDKVAKIIGLPYPGGPSIEKAAQKGNPDAYDFPKAKLGSAYDFSFSGLKTAVLRRVQSLLTKDYSFPSHKLAELLNPAQVNDIAASFQKTAVETLVDKTIQAYQEHRPASLTIGGGVAANSELRRQLSQKINTSIEYPPMSLCTDNAAMIAALGYYSSKYQAPVDRISLEPVPNLKM